MTVFNEDSRVKIPALLHFTRLGYEYLSLKHAVWDTRHNIFPDIFLLSLARINPSAEAADLRRLLDDIHLDLQNEDLGKAFPYTTPRLAAPPIDERPGARGLTHPPTPIPQGERGGQPH